MTPGSRNEQPDDLLSAAEALLEARDHQMLTHIEWGALRQAVASHQARREGVALQPALPAETKVLSTSDGEPGTILNGVVIEPVTGQWIEYEVSTRYGIERWRRSDFVLMSETQNA